MSHYSITVILDKEKVDEKNKEYGSMSTAIDICLREVMARYDESLEVTPYIKKTVEDLKNEYESVLAGAEEKESSYSEEWCKAKKEKGELDSFETYVQSRYEGYSFDQNGNLLTTYNPVSKYDYYSPVSFMTKNGKTVEVCKVKEKALNREIDKEKLQKDYEELISGSTRSIGERITKFGMDALLRKDDLLKKFPSFESYLEQYSVISTYSILTEKDEWNEPGEVGWFGSSSATPEAEGNFYKIYKEILEKTDPEHYVVVLDCHI